MSDDYVDSIRLTHRQRNAVLRSMERNVHSVEHSNRRHNRYGCPLTDVRLIVHRPDRENGRFLVCTRNISAGGISFLHGGFLYPGCRGEITLPTICGHQETITGNIVTCRHIENQIHEFGFAIDPMIDRRRFVTLPGERVLGSGPRTEKGIPLAGRILIIDECSNNADVALGHIKNSKIEIESVASIHEGIVMIRSMPIDAVLLDIDHPGWTPAELIGVIRESGYLGPIIGTTDSPDSDRSRSALTSGADEIVGRPIIASDLIRVLTACLSGRPGSFGPVQCQLETNSDTVSLIEYYLSYIESLVSSLTTEIEEEDLDTILKHCKLIAQSASGYGFPPLALAATDAEEALMESMSVLESLPEIQRLQRVCSRLAPLTFD